MDTPVAAPARSTALLYDGRIGELYRIFPLNILFTILTLGIFRFWAITRYRRYLWSRMRFQGERFEYTGTGGELFVGYLLAGLILIGLFVLAGLCSFILAKISPLLAILPMVLAYTLVAVLAAGAFFSAQRYRLTRTLWCGIRGGMTGSMLRYGARSILYSMLVVVTLLQLTPWMQVRLAERRINASQFGSAQFRFQGRAGRLYPAFLLTFLASTVLLVVMGVAIWFTIQAMHLSFNTHMTQQTLGATMQRLVWILFAAVIVFGVLSSLIRAWYTAMFERHVVGNTTLSDMRFASSMTGRGLFGLMLGNMVIMIVTLGLGYPIILHREARFLARTLWVEGSLDPAALTQSTLSAPRFGEGMFQQLDAGGVFLTAAAGQARFFDGQSAIARDVTVVVEDNILRIRSTDGAVALDWQMREIIAEPSHDGTTVFRCGRLPARLIIAEAAVPNAMRSVKRRSARPAGWTAVLAACAATVAVGILLVDRLPILLAPLVPQSWQGPLGRAVQAALLAQHPRCTGAQGQRALERFVATVAAQGGITRFVQVTVVDNPMVNAFTLPGDRIVIMRGLITTAGDGDELAGVLAHELGHVAHRDPTRHLLRQLGLKTVEFAFGWTQIDAGGLAASLLGLSYGRAAETAADHFAITTLHEAGLRADGLGRFFTRIEAKGVPELGFLADHPSTAEREANVAQPPDGAPAFSNPDWHAIQTMCGRP